MDKSKKGNKKKSQLIALADTLNQQRDSQQFNHGSPNNFQTMSFNVPFPQQTSRKTSQYTRMDQHQMTTQPNHTGQFIQSTYPTEIGYTLQTSESQKNSARGSFNNRFVNRNYRASQKILGNTMNQEQYTQEDEEEEEEKVPEQRRGLRTIQEYDQQNVPQMNFANQRSSQGQSTKQNEEYDSQFQDIDEDDYDEEEAQDQIQDSQMEESEDDDDSDSSFRSENPLELYNQSKSMDQTMLQARQGQGNHIGFYVMFIDPESFYYYRKDLRRDDYIALEPFIDENLKKKFKLENMKHLYKIRKLLILDGFSWNFKGEADLYRRRPFPKQFLKNEASDFPCYVFQSELSKAFNDKGDIQTIIDLLEYAPMLQRNQKEIRDSYVIEFKESLVTSTKEFIKNILRKVYEQYKVKIKARSHYNLILKADGYREYFEGNYQLLQYERVRTCLRKNENMKLILTEIPKHYRDRRFPPIFKIYNEIPPANSATQQQQLNNSQFNQTSPNILNHEEEKECFNYNSIIGSSPYFWYPPVSNLAKHHERMEKQAKSKTSMSNIGSHIAEKNLKKVVYVTPEKELVSLTNHRHYTGGSTIPKQNEQIVLLSGECNWRFKFKLIGVERLNVIFNEIKQKVATDNLNTEPRNVTLKPEKVRSTKPNIFPIEESSKLINQFLGSDDKVQRKQKDQDKKNRKLKDKDLEEIPNIIKKTMKLYTQTREGKKKEENKSPTKNKKKRKDSQGHHGSSSKNNLNEDEQRYLNEELQSINKPYCNFSNYLDTILHYQNILNLKFWKLTPLKLQIECTLYHGCEKLTQSEQSEEIYFNNTLRFNQWIQFGNLRYCQIPMKTRLSFNIIMITKEGYQLTIACVSMNLFDEKGRFRNGMKELNVWPFYELDERLGCMKEYNGMTVMQSQSENIRQMIDSLYSKLVIEFDSFICPLYYSSRDEKKIDFFKLTTNPEDKEDKTNLINVQIKNQDLAKLKRYLNQNPLSKIEESVKRDLFKCREHYQTHPQGLPIFLRSVQWNRPIQVNEVYKMLKNWAAMKPEEAISLLDAKFPDERVRQYAVQRISQLSDDDLALYMLQFAQALLYEEQHYSHLAEMLIERSLKNPYVVGHAFYWSLKSNLYLKPSYERYYVLLEQFLMLCGKFKEEIWIQTQVNEALRKVSQNVVHNKYKEKMQFVDVKERARFDLRKQRKKLPLLFTMTIDPKIVIKDFRYEKLAVFSSKKVPLCLTALNQQPGGDSMVAIFKNGDDLRQDILTLQIIYIMDKIWLSNNLDLAMTPYKVIGTDCEQGYLEFVANCKTLAYIQYKRSVFNTFSDDTIEKYMEGHLKKKYPQKIFEQKLKQARQVFIRSTAGYCVASYVLGLGDRHPDNIMINREEGNFLHIDFGHFLGNVKKKFGIKRERDPFVFTKEIAYFINGGPMSKKIKKIKLSKNVSEEEHKDLSESLMTDDSREDNMDTGDSDIDESMKTKSFRDFEDKCCQAYNILRKEGHQLINMFLIMLSAGMPELKRDDDIQFMVNRLDLNISEQEASSKFKKEIQRAMQTYSRRFDNFIHNIKAKFSK